jgi:hypothetical protein
MEDLKCPFRQALLPGDFGCSHAQPVTRREGPDIACGSAEAHDRCGELLARLREVGLPALGYTDDLNELPHAVAVKVQMGGLLGLRRLLDPPSAASTVVEDVGATVAQAVARYGSTVAVPYAELVPDMASYRLKRRRGR